MTDQTTIPDAPAMSKLPAEKIPDYITKQLNPERSLGWILAGCVIQFVRWDDGTAGVIDARAEIPPGTLASEYARATWQAWQRPRDAYERGEFGLATLRVEILLKKIDALAEQREGYAE